MAGKINVLCLSPCQKHSKSFRIVWSNFFYFWSCFYEHGISLWNLGNAFSERPILQYVNMWWPFVCASHGLEEPRSLWGGDASHLTFSQKLGVPFLEHPTVYMKAHWYHVSKLFLRKKTEHDLFCSRQMTISWGLTYQQTLSISVSFIKKSSLKWVLWSVTLPSAGLACTCWQGKWKILEDVRKGTFRFLLWIGPLITALPMESTSISPKCHLFNTGGALTSRCRHWEYNNEQITALKKFAVGWSSKLVIIEEVNMPTLE